MKNFFSRRKKVASNKNETQSLFDSSQAASSPLDSYRSDSSKRASQVSEQISPPNLLRPTPSYPASLHPNPYPTPPSSNGIFPPRIASPPISMYNEAPRSNRYSTIDPLLGSRDAVDMTLDLNENKLSVSIDFGLVHCLYAILM